MQENKKLSSETSELGNVDQIREILFGSQSRELNKRFEKLEINFLLEKSCSFFHFGSTRIYSFVRYVELSLVNCLFSFGTNSIIAPSFCIIVLKSNTYNS